VGVPDCIHQGELAAAKIVETLKNRQTAARRLPV
jgi:hypothetical protein